MDKVTLEKMATNAFDNAKVQRTQLFSATEVCLAKKLMLDQDEASALASVKFDGKNAETRKAQAREFFDAQYMEIAALENNERSARHHYDLAMFDVDTVKVLLRIAELPVE